MYTIYKPLQLIKDMNTDRDNLKERTNLKSKLHALEQAWIEVGSLRFSLRLNCSIPEEEEIFMNFIRTQNSIGRLEDIIKEKINNL